MKRVLAVLAMLMLMAARSPDPNDGQALYIDGQRVPAAAQAEATITIDSPRVTYTGHKFWVEVNVALDGFLSEVSGSLFYDSLYVRPTGRVRDIYDGLQQADAVRSGTGVLGICPGEGSAHVSGLRWIYRRPVEGRRVVNSFTPFSVEFQAFAPGTAKFAWTSENADCIEPTIAAGDFDVKPTSIVWWASDTLHAVTAADTAYYATAFDTTVVKGDTLTAANFWSGFPDNYEYYVSLTDSLTGDVGDTVTVSVSAYVPQSVDSLCFYVFWDPDAVTYLSSSATHSNIAARALFTAAGVYAADTLNTLSVCGIDSTSGLALTIYPVGYAGGGKWGGEVMTLDFTIDRAGTSVIRLGCDLPAYRTSTIWDELWGESYAVDRPPYNFFDSKRKLLFPNEGSQASWRWRSGRAVTTIVIGS